MMMMTDDNNNHNCNHNNSVERKKMQMKKMLKMNKTSSISRRPLRERERGQQLLYPSYSLSKDLPLFTITESLLYRDSLLTKASFDVITITAADNNNNNSKVDVEEKDEDEDVVVVVTSIVTPANTTTTTTTTVRQQDHLRLLHIVSRWDANNTSKR